MSITTAQLEMLRRDLTQVFTVRSKGVSRIWEKLCTVVPSDGESENYGWLGAHANVREWVGPRKFEELRAFDFSIRNKVWESSELFPVDKLSDGQVSGLKIMTGDLATKANKHPNKLLLETINANPVCFDGQDFFDTDHSAGDSGAQANEIDFAVADPAHPTAVEIRNAFHAGLIQMLGFRDDRNEPFFELDGSPLGDLTVLCPLILYPKTNEAFAAQLIVDGSAAGSNVVIEKPTVIPSIRVGSGYTGGDNTHLDLYYTGDEIKPYAFQAREALKFQVKGQDDIEHNELKLMTKARYNVGVLAWWYAVRVNLVQE